MPKTLYTGGTFDVFHHGHVNFLRQCKLLADRVVVALNTDDFIESFKKISPKNSYDQRARDLLECKFVDSVIPNIGGSDSKPSILEVKPQIVAIGDDWAKKDYYKQMSFTQEWLDRNNIVLVYIPYTKGVSSTMIRNHFLAND